jgi:hypothetical protein
LQKFTLCSIIFAWLMHQYPRAQTGLAMPDTGGRFGGNPPVPELKKAKRQ